MLLVVLGISFLVHVYSIEYMETDPPFAKIYVVFVIIYIFHG